MCLGGPQMPAMQQAPVITPRAVEPGPPTPNDSLNNVDVENVNERSQQDAMRKANRGATASGQKSQSSSKTGKAY